MQIFVKHEGEKFLEGVTVGMALMALWVVWLH